MIQITSVFISYSRQDLGYVKRLSSHLRSAGVDAWFDQNITASQQWWRVIVKQVKAADAIILVMSPEIEKSTSYVPKEVLLAQRESKPIFPLLLRGHVLPLVIDLQYSDVTGGTMPPDDFMAALNALRPPDRENATAQEAPQDLDAATQANPSDVVRPLLIDFGAVDDSYWLDALVESSTPVQRVDANPDLWSVEVDGHEVDLELLDGARIPQRSNVLVATESGLLRVEVRVDLDAHATGTWPAAPSASMIEDRVRGYLQARILGRRSFRGVVGVDTLHVVRVVVESMTETIGRSVVQSPDAPDQPLLTGRLEDLPLPSGWGPQSFAAPVSAPTRVKCEACASRKTVACPTCGGRAKVRCKVHSNSCRMCAGRGVVVGDNESTLFAAKDAPRRVCPRCEGTGAGVCDSCDGSGWKVCDQCIDGRVPCGRCRGRGKLFTYTEGRIDHHLTVKRNMTLPGEGLMFAAADAPWRPLKMPRGAANEFPPNLGDDQLEAWLCENLEGTEQNEIARRTHAEVLPVFSVDFEQHSRVRRLYLVGDQLHVRKSSWLRDGKDYRSDWISGSSR